MTYDLTMDESRADWQLPDTQDPVHGRNGKFFFWSETWADEEGPFDTEEEAREALLEYAANLGLEAPR